MSIIKGAVPFAVALAVVSAVTGVLWLMRHEIVGPQHLVFFYLLPITLVAVLYGTRMAVFCAFVATFCAIFFLYDPLYTLYIETPVEMGELVFFTGLALIGAKCAADLLRPVVYVSRQNTVAEE